MVGTLAGLVFTIFILRAHQYIPNVGLAEMFSILITIVIIYVHFCITSVTNPSSGEADPAENSV